MIRLLFLIGPLCLLFGATLLIAQSNAESFSDKLHHLLFCCDNKDCHYFSHRELDLSVEMAVVPPG